VGISFVIELIPTQNQIRRNKMIDNVKIINYLQDRIQAYKSGGSKITAKDHESDINTLNWYKQHLGKTNSEQWVA
jgi:hypothetical protein